MGPDLEFATSADGVRIAWTSVGTGPALIHLPGVPLSNVEGLRQYVLVRRVADQPPAARVSTPRE